MAATAYPLPRTIRETAPLAGNGTVGPYGPFADFQVFDTADVIVWARASGQTSYQNVTSTCTIAKASGLPLDTVTVTFATAQPNTTVFVVQASRRHERSVSALQGGALKGDELEKELSKQGAAIGETRRDVNRAIRLQPGGAQVAVPLPAANANAPLVWRADGLGFENGAEDYDALRGRVDSNATGLAAETAARISGDAAVTAAWQAGVAGEAQARQAGDAYLAGLIATGLTVDTNNFDSRAAVQGLFIAASRQVISTAGYFAAGDRGDAIHRRATPAEMDAAGVPASGRTRSLDRYLPNSLATDAATGGWWMVITERRFRSPYTFGALGNGVANDTAPCQDWLTMGGGKGRSGTFMVDPLLVPPGAIVDCDWNCVFKKRIHTGTSARTVEFDTSDPDAKGSWTGGRIDGNCPLVAGVRTGGLIASWTNAGGVFDGWFGMVCEAPNVTVERVTFSNWPNYVAWFAGDFMTVRDIRSEACGNAVVFGWRWFGATRLPSRPVGNGAFMQTVENVVVADNDNGGVANVFVHAVDLWACKGGSYRRLTVLRQDGDTASPSDWASGITPEICEDCQFAQWAYLDPTTDTLQHLAFSFVGCVRCSLTDLVATNFAGQAIERNGCTDCPLSGAKIDGKYRATTASPYGSANLVGITDYVGVWSPSRAAKSLAGNIRCPVSNTTIARVTYGALTRNSDIMFSGVKIKGCLKNGLFLSEQVFTTFFAGASARHLTAVLTGCEITECGESAVSGFSYDRLIILGGRIANNGQDTTASADSRAAVSAVSGNLLQIEGCDLGDNQSWSLTRAASFPPQVSVGDLITGNVSPCDRLHVGARVTLGFAAGPVTAMVFDIAGDDSVTFRIAGGHTVVATGNTQALSGTWTTNGTTNTIQNGSGGAANTEIIGRTWVTDGSEWRLAEIATSANTIRLLTAFTTPLAGATLSKLCVDVAGIPSQTYGVRAFGAAGKILLKGNSYEGNLTARTLISDPAQCVAGCEYWRQVTLLPRALTENFLTLIAAGHMPVGAAARVDVALSGGGITSWALTFTNSAGTVLQTFGTGLALAKNTKLTGGGAVVATFADGNLIRFAATGGAPTAGQITLHQYFKVEAPPVLADLP